MTGHPVADAVRIYSEVLQALKEVEKQDQSEPMGKILDSLGDEPPGRIKWHDGWQADWPAVTGSRQLWRASRASEMAFIK